MGDEDPHYKDPWDDLTIFDDKGGRGIRKRRRRTKRRTKRRTRRNNSRHRRR